MLKIGNDHINIGGVMNDPLPPPRIIRGSEQVMPPRLTSRTYTDQLEADLLDSERRNARLSAKVQELEQRLDDVAEEAAHLRSRGSETAPVPPSAQSIALQAARRRARKAEAAGPRVDLGQGVTFDPDAWRLIGAAGVSIRLSPNEGLLLRALARQGGETVLYARLADAVWQDTDLGARVSHALNVTGYRLRARLRAAGRDGLITTVPGIGLRLEVSA